MIRQNKNINETLNAKDILKNKLGVIYGAHVGDLGCGGNGYFTFEVSKLVGQKGKVYAVDILKMVLKNINNRAKMLGIDNIETIWSNLENYGATKINDASLDFVLLVNMLFQNKAPEKVIRETSRILKRGGKVLVIDWREGRFPFGPAAEMKIKAEHISDIALGASLKKIEYFETGKFHYGIIFEKI